MQHWRQIFFLFLFIYYYFFRSFIRTHFIFIYFFARTSIWWLVLSVVYAVAALLLFVLLICILFDSKWPERITRGREEREREQKRERSTQQIVEHDVVTETGGRWMRWCMVRTKMPIWRTCNVICQSYTSLLSVILLMLLLPFCPAQQVTFGRVNERAVANIINIL